MERVTEYTRFHGGMLAVLKNSNRYSAIERLAVIEDILGNDYDLDRLRELVEADRDGRCKIIPVCKGKNCGTCEHFRRIPETRRGTCAVRPFSTDRWGGKKRPGFEPVQSHVACSQYKPALKGDQHGEQ